MFRTIGLSLALILGLGSLMVVGATVIKRPVMLADNAPLQRVEAGAKGDRLRAALMVVGKSEAAQREPAPDNAALKNAAHDIAVAEQMAPLIFAPPSGADAPLMPVAEAAPNAGENNASAANPVAAEMLAAKSSAGDASSADHAEANASQPRKNWRDAHAEANAQDTETPHHRIRKTPTHRPRVTAAREKPADDVKTCVQPTGFNGFLASLNLKPHCQT